MGNDGDVLLVCSGGGHLRQLAGFAERIGYEPERQVWVTFRNALSESLLAGRRVEFVPFTAPRDLRNFVKLVGIAPKILRKYDITEAVSTGSSPAVAFLPRAAARGIPTFYVESAARADGPSMTGRLISRVPGIQTFTQYPGWADAKWQYRGSIFDEYTPDVREDAPAAPRRAVVTVGTQEGYPFDRMLEALVPLLSDFDEVLWQTGDADVRRLGIDGRHSVPHEELKTAIREADVVVSHAGVGSALTALGAGKHPILIPRAVGHREHIDDHQRQVATELSRRGLATLRDADSLSSQDLMLANRSAVRVTVPPPFVLRASEGVP